MESSRYEGAHTQAQLDEADIAGVNKALESMEVKPVQYADPSFNEQTEQSQDQ